MEARDRGKMEPARPLESFPDSPHVQTASHSRSNSTSETIPLAVASEDQNNNQSTQQQQQQQHQPPVDKGSQSRASRLVRRLTRRSSVKESSSSSREDNGSSSKRMSGGSTARRKDKHKRLSALHLIGKRESETGGANASASGSAFGLRDGIINFAAHSDAHLKVPGATVTLESEIDTTGSAATVYRGVWNTLHVAVKQFPETGDPSRFDRELYVSSRLHSNEIVLFNTYNEAKRFIVLEYVDGGTLRSLLKSEGATLQWGDRYAAMNNVAAGISYMHRKHFVHADLRAENLLVCDLNPLRVKVFDFSCSRLVDLEPSESVRDGSTWHGQTRWMPPEICRWRTRRLADRRGEILEPYKVDVFSFAMVFYELITAMLPFEHLTEPTAIAREIISAQRPTLPKLLSMNPDGTSNELARQQQRVHPPRLIDELDTQMPDPLSGEGASGRMFVAEQVSAIFAECWHEDPSKRPSFDHLAPLFEQLDIRGPNSGIRTNFSPDAS